MKPRHLVWLLAMVLALPSVWNLEAQRRSGPPPRRGDRPFPGRPPSARRTNAPSDRVIQPKTAVKLFDGQSLQGWTTWLVDSRREDPRGVFSVTNGLLRISGDGLGYAATEKRYRDYRLVVEWRWGQTNTRWGDRIGRARDSGIFLHATGPDGNSLDGGGAFKAAIECNLFQGATGDFLLIRGARANGEKIHPVLTTETALEPDKDGWFTWKPGGVPRTLASWGRVNWIHKSPAWSDSWDFRGPADLEAPVGQWNQTICVCDEDRIEIWFNGVKVNEGRRAFPSEGQILLQCEGSEIYFRRVELLPL